MHFLENTKTQYAIDSILSIDAEASESISETEFWSNIGQQTQFKDGIDARLIKLGYDGAPDDVKNKVDFIVNQFKKHDMEPISKVNLKNWYTNAAPKDDGPGRSNVYKLCFALEMDALETAEFFFKSYLTRPFNYKDSAEAVYFYCLLNAKSYADAERLIAEVETAKSAKPADSGIATEELGSQIAYINDETELINYLAEHCRDKSEQHKTVTDKIAELLERCYKAATDEANDETEIKGKPLKVKSTDGLLDVIYDYNDAAMSATISDSKLPKALKAGWPKRQTFAVIAKHKVVAEDIYRRALILLTFYDYYAKAYIEQRKTKLKTEIDLVRYANEFTDELNQTLAECGYIQMYPRNPYDGLIFLCTSYPNPLVQFRKIIAEFYLDAVDETEA